MSRTVTSLGGPPPTLNRTKTFASQFENGLDDAVWRDRGFPWHYVNGQADGSYDEQASGQQTLINGENQYYLKPSEITGTVPEWPDNKPWFVRNGNMVLSAIPVPPQYDNIAWAVVEGYDVVSSTSNTVRVRGRSYYDRRVQASRFGLNRYLIDGYATRIVSGGQTYDVTNIQHHNGDPDPASGPTEHTLTISGAFSSSPSGGVNLLRKQRYVSGMMTTRGTFSQKYGSWQMRVKLPKGDGTFAAIWSWSNYLEFPGTNFSNADKSPEVDFVEALGHATDIAYHNLHQPDENMTGFANSLPPLDHSNASPQTPGWTGQHIQQHQVLMDPSNPDYYDVGAEFVTFRWDWYPDGLAGVQGKTCAMYVKRDSWPDFRKLYESYMSNNADDGVIDERQVQINMAMEGDFNFDQEINDASYPRLDGPTSPPWEIEVDYIDVYQWDGFEQGGSGLPDVNGTYPGGLGGITPPGTGTGGGGTTGTTSTGYRPTLGQGIRFSQGTRSGIHVYSLEDRSLADTGRFIWDDYGTDATLIRGERGPDLYLDVSSVTSAVSRMVRWEPDT